MFSEIMDIVKGKQRPPLVLGWFPLQLHARLAVFIRFFKQAQEISLQYSPVNPRKICGLRAIPQCPWWKNAGSYSGKRKQKGSDSFLVCQRKENEAYFNFLGFNYTVAINMLLLAEFSKRIAVFLFSSLQTRNQLVHKLLHCSIKAHVVWRMTLKTTSLQRNIKPIVASIPLISKSNYLSAQYTK